MNEPLEAQISITFDNIDQEEAARILDSLVERIPWSSEAIEDVEIIQPPTP